MAESEEHRFLTEATLAFLEQMSRTKLFAYREADRRRFDFACDLERDLSRPIVGQTLWGHFEGVDKDVRTMLADTDAEVCLYIAQHTSRAERLLREVARDYRAAMPESRPWRLRTVWMPADFDADSEEGRRLATERLAESLTQDLLLNVILGNLSSDNVTLFIQSTGMIGLDLAVLNEVTVRGFHNISSIAKALAVSTGAVRERIVRLQGCGFLEQPDDTGSYFHSTIRGRVFLDLCQRLVSPEHQATEELDRIMRLLGLSSARPSSRADPDVERRTNALRDRVEAAIETWGVDLAQEGFYRYWESDLWPATVPRPERPE